ncbi:MAG: hypothetical protein IKB30_02335 [Clostridia bacterium]|nr:hypothetical protein [Clostridia bacterium]
MDKGKWRKNSQGMIISPEAAKSEMLHAARRAKKHKTNKDSYTNRKLTRKCPKCGAVINNKKTMHRNDALGIYRDFTTVFICGECNAVWRSGQTIKVWQRLKQPSKAISNKEFKKKLQNAF